MTESFPDIEGAVRTWLRTQTDLAALVGQRIFFGVPKKAIETTFPLITVSRVGGGGGAGEAPTDDALLQIDVWGSLDSSGNGLKATCTTIVNTLRAVLRSVKGRTAMTASVDAFGFVEQTCIWLPDPDNDRPRYSVTAEVTALSS